jgi:hypothetical protein
LQLKIFLPGGFDRQFQLQHVITLPKYLRKHLHKNNYKKKKKNTFNRHVKRSYETMYMLLKFD